MATVNFSKKQLNPLFKKYGFSETDSNFVNIIKMFDGQTPYQIWAIGLVFGNGISVSDIKEICRWANENPTEISNLSKENVVRYKSKKDFTLLKTEINGLKRIAIVRNAINKFNTAQREMLRNEIFPKITNEDGKISAVKANQNGAFDMWFDTLSKMETLPQYKKEKLISLASAITDVKFLFNHINDALSKSYDWNREDMLSFMKINASDCKILHDSDNVVVLSIPTFASSKKLCGNGRTAWCITREESYFHQYVLDPKNAHQYMLFDFNRPENNELAHIGFTVRDGQGITNAHSTKNQSLLGRGCIIDGKEVNIQKALLDAKVPKNVYIHLNKLTKFSWSHDSLIKYLEAHKTNFAISLDEGNKVVVCVLNQEALSSICDHTLINQENYRICNDTKVYVVFDFDATFDDDDSTLILQYKKDTYGIPSLVSIFNGYNEDVSKKGVLEMMGIKTSSFLNREKIPPQILLHKFIDEKNEKEAIELIENNGDSFDVNFEFNEKVPVFGAIENGLFNLFNVIVNHKKFDSTTCDGFGETLLQSLIYSYIDCVSLNIKSEEVKHMIDVILSSKSFDFNVQNINLDTAVNIACERDDLSWVAEKLISNKNVNVNVVNDFNCAALGNAIRKHNISAIKLLATRDDVIIRDEDKKLAEKHGINLSEYFSNYSAVDSSVITKDESYSEIFARAFANRK